MMYKYVKRVLDFLVSLLIMPLVAVVIAVVGIAIKCEDGGPIFYMASRIGKGGRIFKMFKFRSMMVNAPDIRLSDGSTFNSVTDARVTKIGRFLRRTSIDEIPQAINILLGDMSFVGPRPDSAMWLSHYTPEQRIVLTVRPGITGYNQVVNRNSVGTQEKIANDMYYVRHFSFRMDARIAVLTIRKVLGASDIYRTEDQLENPPHEAADTKYNSGC